MRVTLTIPIIILTTSHSQITISNKLACCSCEGHVRLRALNNKTYFDIFQELINNNVLSRFFFTFLPYFLFRFSFTEKSSQHKGTRSVMKLFKVQQRFITTYVRNKNDGIIHTRWMKRLQFTLSYPIHHSILGFFGRRVESKKKHATLRAIGMIFVTGMYIVHPYLSMFSSKMFYNTQLSTAW